MENVHGTLRVAARRLKHGRRQRRRGRGSGSFVNGTQKAHGIHDCDAATYDRAREHARVAAPSVRLALVVLGRSHIVRHCASARCDRAHPTASPRARSRARRGTRLGRAVAYTSPGGRRTLGHQTCVVVRKTHDPKLSATRARDTSNTQTSHITVVKTLELLALVEKAARQMVVSTSHEPDSHNPHTAYVSVRLCAMLLTIISYYC
jgi:hypothetical protein